MTGRTRAAASARALQLPSAPATATTTTQTQQVLPTRGRKRGTTSTRGNAAKRTKTSAKSGRAKRRKVGNGSDDGSEDDDGDDDDYDEADKDAGGLLDQRIAVKQEGEAQEIHGSLECDFCKANPPNPAQPMPCNREIRDGFVFECTRCADYRFDTGQPDHECVRTGQNGTIQVFKRYASGHPRHFPRPIVCQECKTARCPERCDADPFLQLTCVGCMGTKARDSKPCLLKASEDDLGWGPDEEREMDPKPNLQKGRAKWFRRECDVCRNRPDKPNGQLCSWLSTRQTGQALEPCLQCTQEKMSCLSSGILVKHPAVLEMPTKWTNRGDLGGGWVDLRGDSNDVFRTQCKQCSLQKRHCRASAQYLEYACNWCWQTGMTCQDKDDDTKIYPQFDLSRIGIGNFCPFARCRRCEETGRNCDRQRPCDSCFFKNESHECDTWEAGKQKTLNCLDRRINHGADRLKKPGPLYYLSMGYGATGVDDVKDGTEIEHYIGPPFARYAFKTIKSHPGEVLMQNKQCIVAEVQKMRAALVAKGVPPLGAPGCELAAANVNDITVAQLRIWMMSRWSNWIPQCSLPEYDEHRDREILSRAYKIALRDNTGVAGTITVRAVVDEEEEEEGEEEEEDEQQQDSQGQGHGQAQAQAQAQAQVQTQVQFGDDEDAEGEIVYDLDVNGGYLQGYQPYPTGVPLGQAPSHAMTSTNTLLPSNIVPAVYGSTVPTQPNQPNQQEPTRRPISNIPYTLHEELLLVTPFTFGDASAHALSQLGRWTSFFPHATNLPPEAASTNLHTQFPIPDFGLFSIASGVLVRDSPIRQVLNWIPWPPNDTLPQGRCMERAPACDDICTVAPCVSLTHQSLHTVCSPCNRFTNHLIQGHADAIQSYELVEMRAYFCKPCHLNLCRGPGALRDMYVLGAKQIWGTEFSGNTSVNGVVRVNGRQMVLNRRALPATGCSCGSRIFGSRLCQVDRVNSGRVAMYQARRMIDWRISQGESGRCPGCLLQTSANEANYSPSTAEIFNEPANSQETVSWACLVCGDIVINQFKKNALVPGWQAWFDGSVLVSNWGQDPYQVISAGLQ